MATTKTAADRKATYRLTVQERNTVLAALRYYQEEGLADDPKLRSDWIHAIATDHDDDTSLDGAGIDKLCDKLH